MCTITDCRQYVTTTQFGIPQWKETSTGPLVRRYYLSVTLTWIFFFLFVWLKPATRYLKTLHLILRMSHHPDYISASSMDSFHY